MAWNFRRFGPLYPQRVRASDKAKTDAKLIVMDGEPIAEPVIGQSRFVMNSRAEIQQAFEDYQFGKMGELVS